MSEPHFDLLDDYARVLDRESAMILPPMSPAEVRRAGTSRRRRQSLAVLAIVVALALAIGGVVIANLTSRSAAPDWATTPTTPVTLPTSSVSPSGRASTSPSGKESTSPSGRASTSQSGRASTSGVLQPVVAASDVITMLGIGELKLGMSRAELVSRGVMSAARGCDVISPAPTLSAEGITIASTTDSVGFILVHTPQHKTQSGAAVGMTMAQVKQIYGDKVAAKSVTLEIGDPQGNTREAYVISSGNMLVFMSDSRASIAPSDIVTTIYLLKGNVMSIPVEIC